MKIHVNYIPSFISWDEFEEESERAKARMSQGLRHQAGATYQQKGPICDKGNERAER